MSKSSLHVADVPVLHEEREEAPPVVVEVKKEVLRQDLPGSPCEPEVE